MLKRQISVAASAAVLGLYGSTPSPARAQNTVPFNYTDPGVPRSVAEWGIDTALNHFDNVRQSVANMAGEQTSADHQ